MLLLMTFHAQRWKQRLSGRNIQHESNHHNPAFTISDTHVLLSSEVFPTPYIPDSRNHTHVELTHKELHALLFLLPTQTPQSEQKSFNFTTGRTYTQSIAACAN